MQTLTTTARIREARRIVDLIRANVDRFYSDDDYGRFGKRQRVIWNIASMRGLLDDVSDILAVRP